MMQIKGIFTSQIRGTELSRTGTLKVLTQMAFHSLSSGAQKEKVILKYPDDLLIHTGAVSHETQCTAVLCSQHQPQSVLDTLPVSLLFL